MQTELPTLPVAGAGPLQLLFGFPLAQKALFFRNLATLVGAALALPTAVSQASQGNQTRLGQEMTHLLQQGYPLSAVMARYPHYFNPYEINVVACAEYAGNLDETLQTLAAETEHQLSLQRQLSARLAYPALMVHAAIFIPTLPLLVTRSGSVYLRTTLSLLLPLYLILGSLWLLYRLGGQVGPFRVLMDTVLAYTPVVSGAVRGLATVRFLRTLAHLTEAGALPDKALAVACAACGNGWLAGRVRQAIGSGEVQIRTSEVLSRSRVFNPLVISLASSGEESGQLGPMLSKACQHLEQDLVRRLNLISTLLPVLVLLGVGAVVGGIVIRSYSSLYQGLFNI